MKASHTLCGAGVHGIPKQREVDKRLELCEWEGSVCVREAIGATSMLRLICRAVAFLPSWGFIAYFDTSIIIKL